MDSADFPHSSRVTDSDDRGTLLGLSRSLFLIILVIVALLVRFGATVTLRGSLNSPPLTRLGADGVEYDSLGYHLAQGDGYTLEPGHPPTSFRAPGFPFFLAALYALAGHNYVLAHLSFCALGALSCLLTYFLTRELADEGLARLAAVLAIFYLPHIYFATVYESENLFIPCLALGIWLFVRHLRTESLACLGGAGLALGYGTLIRAYSLLLLPILLAVLVGQWGRQRRLPILPLVAFTATFLLPILPWTARNYAVHGRFVLLATNGGSTFYGGNNDRVVTEFTNYGNWLSTRHLPFRDRIEATPNEVAHDKMEWHLGLEWLKAHPAALPKLLAFKFVRLWLPNAFTANRKNNLIQMVGYCPYLLLFVLGAAECLRYRRYWTASWLAVHGALAATVITALIFWGSPRFRDANTSLLMIYAALGWETLVGGWQRLRSGAASSPPRA